MPCIAEDLEIFLEQTTYSTFENELQLSITLRVSEPYQQGISVTVDVDELEGECLQGSMYCGLQGNSKLLM